MAYTILIVDDSMLTRMAIRRILEMLDLDMDEILESTNGEEALNQLEEHDVDLVLADLNMPQMGGIELVHRMKASQDTAQIPVVVVSTESSTTRVKDLLAEGVKDFLHKPFTPEEFRAILMKNLEAYHDDN
ncbi:MAG: response regulator [Sedimentisphaerales bacterium]|nr:response regulator [Sedimentisphaerales bacterium]